ncbi:MAG UNVERIFIED_CONTAM: hypothetical protein LVR29_16790 [Microcystis novacekii LVE1205-3]|jgi:hypothetical protein
MWCRLAAQGINLTETTVADVMVHPLITLPQQSFQDIFAALFLFRRYPNSPFADCG